jgi:predicted N-acyltransferase
VTGRRFLTAGGSDRPRLMRALADALLELAKEVGASSVHVNFAREDEIALLAENGFVERHGVQYHWYRRDAERFDDYLARFTSKKRNQVKRERRAIEEEGIRIETLRGGELEGDQMARLMFALYKSTVDKFYWGHQYLNLDFFRAAPTRMKEKMELVLARKRSGEPVAGAINFAGERRLYGRYWGAIEDVRFLHFDVCYYRGIEECLARGFEVFEPGAGGEHKLVRGFEPTMTKSAHYFADRRLRSIIEPHIARERAAIAAELQSAFSGGSSSSEMNE